MISPDTITLCLELLDTISVPVNLPDGDEKWARLRAARQELLAALDDDT